MKNLLIMLCLLTAASTPVKSQTVFPSLSDNPSWNVVECFWTTCSTQTYQYVYDTAFCGQVYSKIVYDAINQGYIRSDASKTYLRKSGNCSGKEYLMYDYSLSIGDTAYVGYNLCLSNPLDTTAMVLVQIDTVNYFGVNRQRLKLISDPCNFGIMMYEMFWIKGIGATVHPFYSIPCLCDFCESYYTVLCYDSASVQYYQNPNFTSCVTAIDEHEVFQTPKVRMHPNPAISETQILITDPGPVAIKIYNTTGQLLYKLSGEKNLVFGETLLPGIYFVEVSGNTTKTTLKLIKL